jgi:V/A-type H+/Na+-transporting ATPase subunit I
MFFPQEMTEMELIVPEKDLLAVTKLLAGQGVFQQVDASQLSARTKHEPNEESWKERASTYATLERQIQALMQSFGVEPGSPQADQLQMVEIETIRPLVEKIESEAKDATSQLAADEKLIAQYEGYIHELSPVADIDLDIGVLRNPRYLHSILGTMPASNMERLETSLARTPFVLMPLREDRKEALVWLTGAKENADILDRAARSAYLDPFDFSEVREGTPAEIIQSLRKDIENAKADMEKQKAAIAQLRVTYESQLQTAFWSVRGSRMLADAMAHFGKLKYTYLIVGWVPSAKVPGLTEKLKQVSANIIIDTTASKPAEAGSNVPVSLHNPGILGAFEMLVTTFARPRYNEIDPTVLISFTFPLLFGAMFGDVGQGLVLALLGLLLASKIVPAMRGMAGLGQLVLVCGLSATLFGFIYGSIFGFEEVLPHHPFFKQFVLLQPLHNILGILGIAVGVGVVIISVAYLLNIYNAFRARDWGRFFFDPNGLAGLILYWSFLALVGLGVGSFIAHFPVPSIVFTILGILVVVTALLSVVFSEPLKHWVEGHYPLIHGGIGMFAAQSAAELLEKIISMFSNTMSYARVGAFAVAHAGFSLAVFVFADLASGGTNEGFGYWAMVVFGNIFIIGFEGFIVSIQTMRLHYYEFFSKFFNGGGAPYEPLTPAIVQEK